MIKNLKPEHAKKAKPEKELDSTDAALESIGERLAAKQLQMQQLQGKSVDEVVKDLDQNMNKDEQKEIYKKFFNENDEEEKPSKPTEQDIQAQRLAEEKRKADEEHKQQMERNQYLKA